MTRSEHLKMILLEFKATTPAGSPVLTTINFGKEIDIDIFGGDSETGDMLPYSYRFDIALAPGNPEVALPRGGKLYDLGECNIRLRLSGTSGTEEVRTIECRGYCFAQIVATRFLLHLDPTKRKYFKP